MAVIKVTNSKATLSKAINYVTKEEKTETRLISGHDCNPSTALEEMKATKEQFNKLEGRQYCHYVQSFAKTDNVNYEKAHEIGKEWAAKSFKGHEVLIATHQDKDHVHNHFIVNSVSHEDGKKFHSSKKDLAHLKEISDKICEREGLSVITEKSKEITSFNQNKYKAIEKSFEGNYKSYVVDTALSVSKAIPNSRSKEEFIKNMESQGYSVKWTDTNKNVTFTNSEGEKVRLSNLQKTFKDEKFSKEGLENEFTRIRGKELAKSTETVRTQANRGVGGNVADSQDIGIKVLLGNIPRGNEVSSSRVDQPIGAIKESFKSEQIGQGGLVEKASREREGKEGAYSNSEQSNISIEKRSRGNEESQLSENRGSQQESELGIKGESRVSQEIDKGYIGISASSEEHSESIMEGKSEAILNSAGNNSRLDSGNSGIVSSGNTFSEVLKALDGAIKKMEYKEQLLADKESAKLEREMNRQPKTKNKSKSKGWERE